MSNSSKWVTICLEWMFGRVIEKREEVEREKETECKDLGVWGEGDKHNNNDNNKKYEAGPQQMVQS